VRIARRHRGIAIVTVLLATALLLVLVAVLVDLGTIQLQRSTADLRSLQALAGADAGTAWVRAELELEKGDIEATIERLGQMQGKHRFTIDDQTYVVVSVLMITATQQSDGDHVDENLESNPQVLEAPVQVEATATLFTDGDAVARRSTTTLLRVFPAAPYSAEVGFIDDGGPVGIDSPGDAGGQLKYQDTTELLVHAYTVDANGNRHEVDDFNPETWSDGNTQGPGPLP
jgi:hypothetical protein